MSNFGTLNWKDIVKGVVVAILTVVVAGVSTSLNAGAFPSLAELQQLGLMGLAAGVAYLFKNVFTNSQGQTFTKETKPPTP